MFHAHYEPQGAGTGVALLDEPREAIVRMSRALGLPTTIPGPGSIWRRLRGAPRENGSIAVPDILGFALRFPDAHGSGRHQDLVLATTGAAPIARHLLLPSPGFFSLRYTSLLTYAIAGETRLVASFPATPEPGPGRYFDQLLSTAAPTFSLALATLTGAWRPIGTITLGERVSDGTGERIRFNPWNTGGEIRPNGPFMGLRAGAYRGSQAGWHK